MFTDTDLTKVLKIEPQLTQQGITHKKDIEVPLDRFYLRNNIIQKVCDIIKDVPKIKTITDKSPGSYHMKHVLENIIGEYVSNGEMIAASIHMGFSFKRTYSHGSEGTILPNIRIGFSKIGYRNILKLRKI